MRASRRLVGNALLSAVVLSAKLFSLPSLLDVATGLPPAGAHLTYPFGHVALAPLSLLGDVIACQSARASIALLFMLATAGFAFFRYFVLAEGPQTWRRPAEALKAFGIYAILLAAALAWCLLLPRPAARLTLDDEQLLAVDFHSHTAASWDGRKSFNAESSARWHEKTGFHAAFITDHNVFSAAAAAHGLSRMERERGRAFVSMTGEELSLHGAHVVSLGNSALIKQEDYSDGEEGLKRFFKEAGPKHGALSVMSLPEYERHYRARLGEVAGWGVDGFELVAASPRGLDLDVSRRREISAFCRERNLLALGATDNHGYGGAACVWNVARLPGWRAMTADVAQEKLLELLGRERYAAVRVLERPRRDVPRDWTVWLHGFAAVYDGLRRQSWGHVFFNLLFIWGIWLFFTSEGKIRTHP